MKTLGFALIALAIVFTATVSPAQNLLANPDFEAGSSGWTTFNNAFIEQMTAMGDPCVIPQSGNWCGKMFGNWWGSFNVSGMFQEFPAL